MPSLNPIHASALPYQPPCPPWSLSRTTSPPAPPCLPVGEEDDGLDHEELGDGIERLKQVLGGHVEEDERVDGHRVGQHVHRGDVGVAVVQRKVAVLVETVVVEQQREEGEQRLEVYELQAALLAVADEAAAEGREKRREDERQGGEDEGLGPEGRGCALPRRAQSNMHERAHVGM